MSRTTARRSAIKLGALLLLLCACNAPPDVVPENASPILRDPDDVAAVRTAYHERMRLGLGSPFRLLEIAARDARLDEETREDLLRELFDRIADGQTYEAVHTLPAPHQRIVEYAVAAAEDPRIGELAVNLAYEIATQEKRVTPELQYAAVCTAALLRDRALARLDAERIREQARTHDLAPHTLVPALRAQRALLVEQPHYFALDASRQNEASRLAMMFIGGVRQATTIPGLRWPSQRTIDAAPDFAERILALHRERAQPPQSALMMMMQQSQLPFGGRDEEEFIAELAAAMSPTLANVAAQRAAIALRPLAQEPIWHAQMSSPTTAALLAEFGVRVVINDEIPQAWHPYYRAQLARALGDMRSVLPKLVLEGLTIEIADIDTTATHLAFHDPGARLIRLAPRAVMGSLAHELGHDLDWQIARRSYRRRASYASDYAADVAATMERTTPWARLTMRPTEVLARQFDWVVYMMLAEQRRLNGTLTSVQHDWLPGHGGARPPAANVRSATAFAGVIERAVRLDGSMSDAIKRAVLAYDVPASVHAVRAARNGIGRLPDGMTASPETRSYIEALFVAAGVMKAADPRSRGCSAFAITPCL